VSAQNFLQKLHWKSENSMIVTGALADPKEGPDPSETSFEDLFWEAAENGLSSR
jgi:hypothetical protein